MKKSLDKEVDRKLNDLYYREQKLFRRSRDPGYSDERFSEDVKDFLEYCIEERKNWAQKGYESEDFWRYAFHLGKKIMRWGKKY